MQVSPGINVELKKYADNDFVFKFSFIPWQDLQGCKVIHTRNAYEYKGKLKNFSRKP